MTQTVNNVVLSLLEGLNAEQRRAVEATDGRVLILAGAGSGKTRVLTVRMAYLIANGVDPKSILGLTFTNKAAAEMLERVGGMVSSQATRVMTVCTFHSFCMKILKKEIHHLGYTNKFTLFNQRDVQRLITEISRELLDRDGEMPSLSEIMESISHAQNHGLKPSDLPKTGNKWYDQFLYEVYSRYLSSMRAYNAVDFDTLQTLTVKLFDEHPQVLERYQDRFQYIMIDEYQDTNPIQFTLADLLSRKYGNLCVVGDDDQSIYGWRGADVSNILNFSDANIIKLEQNYRSTNTILNAANAVIKNNDSRYEKSLWSKRKGDVPIELMIAPDDEREAQAMVHRLVMTKEKYNLRWRDCAILYRSNVLSRSIENALMKYTWYEGNYPVKGIPYKINGGVELYERREVKDICAYLRVIVNPSDQEALLRIINYPRRGISDRAVDHLTSYNRSQRIPLWDVINHLEQHPSVAEKLSNRATEGIKNYLMLLQKSKESFEQLPLDQALNQLIEKINYQKAIHDEVKSEAMRKFKWENVQDLVKTFSEQNGSSLDEAINTIPLAKDWEGQNKQFQGDSVNVMTMHSAKGLEFQACFLVGIEDNTIPHEKSLKEKGGIDEERRLMYVAITRAMKFLTISMAMRRKKMGKEYKCTPSRFLKEIPKELIQCTKWDSV